ncbi:DUF742 domain-containing protein [Streptomyces sp. NPDC006655]|uniref:DUF742 domain-containing protein n=1 Tax=Streptomyces sp. NPDC006655 TaxID=3156898 RepID=UPI0034550804
MAGDDGLLDDDLGAVRPFALVGGRVTPSQELDRASLVKARPSLPSDPLQSHYAKAFALCQAGAVSVAEIAARLSQPLQIVKIWLSDLIVDGYLTNAMPDNYGDAATDPRILGEVLAGLQRL